MGWPRIDFLGVCFNGKHYPWMPVAEKSRLLLLLLRRKSPILLLLLLNTSLEC
jgi:hypothetical protein